MRSASRRSFRSWRLGSLPLVFIGFILAQASWAGGPARPEMPGSGPPYLEKGGFPVQPKSPSPIVAWPCGGPIDDLVVGEGVDLGQRGFDVRLLGEGYSLQSFSVRSDYQCPATGEANGAGLVADTQWLRSSDNLSVFVTQDVAPATLSPVIEWDWATFSADGYGFQVYLPSWWWGGGGGVLSPSSGSARSAPAARAEVAEKGFSAERGPRVPAFARPETKRWAGDPQAIHPRPRVLIAKDASADRFDEVLTRLAPGIDLACFYRRTGAGWEDLPSLGLGDPRPALPAELSESYLDVSYLRHPAEGCEVPAPQYGEGTSFYASFSSAEGGWAGVSAYSLYPGAVYGGYIDDWGAYWSDERFGYSVYASVNGHGDRALIERLAKGIDPDFSYACLAQGRYLTPEEAVALGFHLARPPEGFYATWSQLYAQSALPECASPPPAAYYFAWSFTDGVDLEIDASVNHWGGPAGDGTVYYGSGYLSWTDVEGTAYSVYGYSFGGNEPPSLELLEGVARSMDPSFPGVPAE